jgi:hypothetical protein
VRFKDPVRLVGKFLLDITIVELMTARRTASAVSPLATYRRTASIVIEVEPNTPSKKHRTMLQRRFPDYNETHSD